MEHYAQIGVMEVFLEATPSVFLFLILYVRIKSHAPNEEGLDELLKGSNWVQELIFWFSFFSSIFSSAFGVARYSRLQIRVESPVSTTIIYKAETSKARLKK